MKVFSKMVGSAIENVYQCLDIEDDMESILLAILLQNGTQEKNTHRVEAITEGRYVDLMNPEAANSYIKSQLKNLLLNRLREQERGIEKQFRDKNADQLAEKILLAPDVYYAAVMMNKN